MDTPFGAGSDVMVALRSRRLEGIFGARLEDVSHAQIRALVTNTVGEDFDLDFKETLYGRSDKAKRDLAGDVAALANTAGGVLVLGVAEDDQARASNDPGVDLDNAEQDRIRQIVAETVHPTPVIDVVPKEDPQRPGHGFLLIAVPRSPMAPHAVKVDIALRYPRRYGTTTTYLSEAQVATAYRERFAGFQNRLDDLAVIEQELVDRLDVAEQTFVVVTLIPDLPGDFLLNNQALRDFQQQVAGRDPLIVPRGIYLQQASVGSRRLIAHGGPDHDAAARYLACDLHQSGAGAFAAIVDNRRPFQRDDEPAVRISKIHDEDLVLDIWSGLRFLARHARDRAAAGGNATVRATVWPVTREIPAVLTHPRGFGSFENQLGRRQVAAPPVATSTFTLDDLADDAAPLVAATSVLSAEVIQHFGYPETLQMSADGTIRRRYWDRQRYAAQVEKWAAASGVDVTDEVAS